MAKVHGEGRRVIRCDDATNGATSDSGRTHYMNSERNGRCIGIF